MATSGDTALTLTARDYITRAMQACRIVALGEQPEAAEIEAGRLILSAMLKTLQTQGLSWGVATLPQTIAAGERSITLPKDMRAVESIRVVQGTHERELYQLSRAEYQVYPAKSSSGVPSSFYVDRQRDASILTVWPVPTTDTVLSVDYARALDTVSDVSETIDVPEEWAEAIWTNLALRMATEFGAEVTPELARRADMLMASMLDDSRPESYFMAGWDG